MGKTKMTRVISTALVTLGLFLSGLFVQSSAFADTAQCKEGFFLATIAGSTSCQPNPRVVVTPAPEPNVTAPKPAVTEPVVSAPEPEPEPKPTAVVKPGCVTTGGGTACGGAQPSPEPEPAIQSAPEPEPTITLSSLSLPKIILLDTSKMCLVD